MLKAVFTCACITALGFVAVAPTSAAGVSPGSSPNSPLRVSIDSVDGRATIKLARQLTVLSSCSRTCRARIDLILRTPTNTLRLNRFGRVAPGVPWTSTIALSGYGFDYLSRVWRSSSLRVVVTATDPVNSKRTVKSRLFRLRLR